VLQYYKHMEEMEWAASICIGPEGDMHNVSTAECAIRMAKAINHYFDPLVSRRPTWTQPLFARLLQVRDCLNNQIMCLVPKCTSAGVPAGLWWRNLMGETM
jgi:hypothetical protein